jgi:hypothetical protein
MERGANDLEGSVQRAGPGARVAASYFDRPNSAIRISIVRASISLSVRYADASVFAALIISSRKMRIAVRMERESSQAEELGSTCFRRKSSCPMTVSSS